MRIKLPDENSRLADYEMIAKPVATLKLSQSPVRTVFSAAHVVADPMAASGGSARASIDWDATMAFRRHLTGLGLGIAEAMDTAQRGMGLDWPNAFELIRRTRSELPDALVFNGAGTDQLDPKDTRSMDDVVHAYMQQIEAIQKIGGRIILMASRALAQAADNPDDYIDVYTSVLANCNQPVILHWLGEMFDPQLKGYWGTDNFDDAMQICLGIMEENRSKIDGIKISLLDKDKEITMRRKLPDGVKMYTGDDFNYPELIAGDEYGYSHALLGIFDPLSSLAAHAVEKLSTGDKTEFHAVLDSTIPLARKIFMAPTQYYKTGVVFLAWLNGFQNHFVMLDGAQSMRPLSYFTEIFKLADQCGALRNPELAVERMSLLLSIYGVEAGSNA